MDKKQVLPDNIARYSQDEIIIDLRFNRDDQYGLQLEILPIYTRVIFPIFVKQFLTFIQMKN